MYSYTSLPQTTSKTMSKNTSFMASARAMLQRSLHDPKAKKWLLGVVAAALLIFVALLVPGHSTSGTAGSSLTSRLRAHFGGSSSDSSSLAAAEQAAKHAKIKAELGHGTWNMLHRMAASYEKEPSLEQQKEMRTFITTFSKLYPCEECATEFRAMLAVSPPDVSNNRALSLWFCETHNKVNKRLGKPLFTCTLESLKEAYGDCGCFDAEGSGAPAAAASKA